MDDFIKNFYNILIIGGLTLLLVGGLFTLSMILSTRKTSREKGKTPIYSERCGGKFGLINFTYPFVRLSLYEDFLVISSWVKLTIDYRIITRIKSTGVFGTGIEILTTDNNKYSRPIIWTSNRNFVMETINSRLDAPQQGA